MSDAAVSMTWEEYQALGQDVRGEYIDGTLVVIPPPDCVTVPIFFWAMKPLDWKSGPTSM